MIMSLHDSFVTALNMNSLNVHPFLKKYKSTLGSSTRKSSFNSEKNLLKNDSNLQLSNTQTTGHSVLRPLILQIKWHLSMWRTSTLLKTSEDLQQQKNEHNPEIFVLCATTAEHLLVFHIKSAVTLNQTKAWTQVAAGHRWPGNPPLKKETRGTPPCMTSQCFV